MKDEKLKEEKWDTCLVIELKTGKRLSMRVDPEKATLMQDRRGDELRSRIDRPNGVAQHLVARTPQEGIADR